MKTNEKTDAVLPLALPMADGVCSMPEFFVGMFQAGFESGYKNGRETSFREGYAAAHQGPSNGAAVTSAADARTAPKGGPRRMLLGMPCERCRVYLLSDETSCPCCKQPRAA
jgi:hypothetical protein